MSGTGLGPSPVAGTRLGVVTHVCRVAALHDDESPEGVTAIDKQPVDGPVAVGAFGIRGDVQASRRHHGGPDKAVYAVDEAETDHWATELGRVIAPGLFGENLRVRGPVDDAEIGERWRVGELLEVEVTGPRTPCSTFARWLGQEGWVARYARRARPGVYLRVVVPGPVEAGAEVAVLDRPGHGVSVARWFAGQDPADARTLLDAHAAGRVSLAPYVLPHVERAAQRGDVQVPAPAVDGE